MSALHRVDDIRSMRAPRFFTFAERLPAYHGAVRAALVAAQEQQAAAASAPTDPRSMTALRHPQGGAIAQYTQTDAVDPPPKPPARLLGA